ncbi:2Fe-2S iron-sulfur cluster-binding protein [Streptomyces sp. NPDC127091]|uniref:2Fe-2S iron-sulfur cluster-binding protein n=1 Tax=Streptomyces sp. NPDC127091 TaxID=3347134 RepID=UPI003651F7F8
MSEARTATTTMERPHDMTRLVEDILTTTGLVEENASTKRPNKRGEQTRDKIVRAAAECFSEYGYTRTRISDIAYRAHTAQGNFYRHFTSLDDVFLAVLKPGLVELARASSRRRRPTVDLDVLVENNTVYLESYARHRHVLRLLREAAASSANGGFQQLWLRLRGDFVHRTRRWLQRLSEAGQIGPTDLDLLAESLGCLTEQMAYIHVGLPAATPRRERLEELGRTLGEVWLRSLPVVDPKESAEMTATISDTPVRSSLGTQLTVRHVVRETPDAVSVTFEKPAGPEFRHEAGQFLTLAVPSERTGHVARCYSLATATNGDLTVTVKRTPDGYASRWIFDNAAPGLVLDVLPPAGSFTVPDLTGTVVLVAAGSGITPCMAILRTVLEQSTGSVALFYANRDRSATIFAEALDELCAAHPDRLTVEHWYEDAKGLPGAADLGAWLDGVAASDVWTCGPAPFMEAVVEAGRASGGRRVHREEYISLSGDPFAPVGAVVADEAAATVHVEIDGDEHELAWPAENSLVEVMLAAGIPVPYSCREGECGSCVCHLDEGTVEPGVLDALDPEDVADGYILGCQARPTSTQLKIVF